jgi:peptide/nickel transport system substrate-binding protein
MGQDGNPLPYIDKIEFMFLGAESAPNIAGLLAGEIDIVDSSDTGALTVYNGTKNKKQINVLPITTCQTRILRMRVDLKPWSDNRVRAALKLCQNREKILGLAFFGEGLEGQDFHVSPKHPEYCQKNTPEYDPQRAKELLKQAGYSNGLDINLATNADLPEIVRYAEILKEDARPAGFNINIKTVPASNYWEKWTEYDLGITTWGHRPLGTMVLNLAYTGDENGKPVSWNETRWVDKEFSELLKKANGTLDLDERRKIFCRLEEIQQKRGSIGNAFWLNTWLITSKRVHGVKAHPSNYLKFDDAWLSV